MIEMYNIYPCDFMGTCISFAQVPEKYICFTFNCDDYFQILPRWGLVPKIQVSFETKLY